ncbi:GNAT family N-acetyltransferase [Paenibacillus cremeus]|nr:GNAT family N-acetyltransferase [Paenibacillus cremeus]
MFIRKAEMNDAGPLCGLSGQLGYAVSEAQMSERLGNILPDPEHAVFVMEVEDEIAGWVHVHGRFLLESAPFAEIGGLVVSNRHRRQGIGEKLMRACETWAREQGFSAMRVRSGAQRKEAHAFYVGIGYANVKAQQVFHLNL